MEPLLLIPIVLGFFMTFVMIPVWIKKARILGLVWEDMNKYKKEKVAGSGGIVVIWGFVLSTLVYIAIKTFYFSSTVNVIEIFALTTTILLLNNIGVIDDLLGWHHGGLTKKFRILLCVFAAIPLMVINSNNHFIDVPFFGSVSFGLLYPLILIPIGITGAATTFNFLAGFNGLESGQGIIILTSLSLVSYLTGNSWLALIGLIMVSCLIAFWLYNKVPAKVFPGDSLTYSIGGMIAIIAILGKIEKIALFFFIPYIIEFFLKLRGNLNKHSFGKPNKDNSLDLAYDKIYGLEHFSIWFLKKIKNRVYERDVVKFIYFIQIITIILGFLIFKNSILK